MLPFGKNFLLYYIISLFIGPHNALLMPQQQSYPHTTLPLSHFTCRKAAIWLYIIAMSSARGISLYTSTFVTWTVTFISVSVTDVTMDASEFATNPGPLAESFLITPVRLYNRIFVTTFFCYNITINHNKIRKFDYIDQLISYFINYS